MRERRRPAAPPPKATAMLRTRILRFSQHLSCETCGTSYEELTPHNFSFNSRLGWCPSCEGLGVQRGTRTDSIIVQPKRTLLTGAIAGWHDAENRPLMRAVIHGVGRRDRRQPRCRHAPISPMSSGTSSCSAWASAGSACLPLTTSPPCDSNGKASSPPSTKPPSSPGSIAPSWRNSSATSIARPAAADASSRTPGPPR